MNLFKFIAFSAIKRDGHIVGNVTSGIRCDVINNTLIEQYQQSTVPNSHA